MAGRWNEDQERAYRGRDDDRYDVFGLNDERDRDRSAGREDRSFGTRERVFGERDSGASYNRPRGEDRGWQEQRYGGVSPAMQRGDYDTGYRANPRFPSQDYTRAQGGGRFYGDDGHGRIYREDYGASGRDFDEGHRFGSRSADERWAREMRRPVPGRDYSTAGRYGTYSGGTGGYDYERGYGDAGRAEERPGYEERAREAGEFFRRTGRKISNWFSEIGRDEQGDYAVDRERYDAYRGARGLGPKDYKRSDERISDDAHQRLTDDPWVDASEINVSVSGGEVTLSGTVESREAKHRAERIVEDLSGVNHVQNNLRIKPGGYFTRAGRGYGDSVHDAQMRGDPVQSVTDGDHSMQTSANATGTTSRKT